MIQFFDVSLELLSFNLLTGTKHVQSTSPHLLQVDVGLPDLLDAFLGEGGVC